MIFKFRTKKKEYEEDKILLRKRIIKDTISRISMYEKRINIPLDFLKNCVKLFMQGIEQEKLELYQKFFTENEFLHDLENLYYTFNIIYPYCIKQIINNNTRDNTNVESKEIMKKIGLNIDLETNRSRYKRLALMLSFTWCDLAHHMFTSLLKELENLKSKITELTDKIEKIKERIDYINKDLVYGEQLRQNTQIFNSINSINESITTMFRILNDDYNHIKVELDAQLNSIKTTAQRPLHENTDAVINDELNEMYKKLNSYNIIVKDIMRLSAKIKLIDETINEFESLLNLFVDKDFRRMYINDIREIYHRLTKTVKIEINPEEFVRAIFYPVQVHRLSELTCELSTHFGPKIIDNIKKGVENIWLNYSKIMTVNLETMTIIIE